jgi:hypothetical protein
MIDLEEHEKRYYWVCPCCCAGGPVKDTLYECDKAWNKRSDTNVVSTRSPDVAEAIGEIDNLIIHKYQYNLVEYFGEGIKEDLTKIKKLLEVKGG